MEQSVTQSADCCTTFSKQRGPQLILMRAGYAGSTCTLMSERFAHSQMGEYIQASQVQFEQMLQNRERFSPALCLACSPLFGSAAASADCPAAALLPCRKAALQPDATGFACFACALI